jgi:predicted enzyme related to lactoylglutathione lyase
MFDGGRDVVDVQNIHIAVQDLDEATEFYSRLLNSSVQFRDADRWAQFQLSRGKFALASIEEAAAAPGTTTVVFEVDDLAETAALVEGQGGRVISTRDMGSHGTVVTCVDCSGGRFQIFGRA